MWCLGHNSFLSYQRKLTTFARKVPMSLQFNNIDVGDRKRVLIEETIV